MTGCRFDAKNTLDKNYLYLAEKKGASVLAENKVISILPEGNTDGKDGYRVTARSSTSLFAKKKKSYRAKGIIFSGGVLGTVRLFSSLGPITKVLSWLRQKTGRKICRRASRSVQL